MDERYKNFMKNFSELPRHGLKKTPYIGEGKKKEEQEGNERKHTRICFGKDRAAAVRRRVLQL